MIAPRSARGLDTDSAVGRLRKPAEGKRGGRRNVDHGKGRARAARLIDIVKARSFQSGPEVKLASGRTSTYYFNMKPTMLDAEGAHLIATLILDPSTASTPILSAGWKWAPCRWRPPSPR